MKDSIRGGFWNCYGPSSNTGLTRLIMGLQDLSLCFSVDPGQFVVSLGTTFLKECGKSVVWES